MDRVDRDTTAAQCPLPHHSTLSRVHVFLHDAPASHAAAVKLDFLHGGAKDRDDFLEQMKHLLGLRQWERVPLPPTTGPAAQQQQPGPGAEAPAFTTRTAGVGGIMRRQEHARAAQDRLATEAFADLSTLMDKAREVVRDDVVCWVACVFSAADCKGYTPTSLSPYACTPRWG